MEIDIKEFVKEIENLKKQNEALQYIKEKYVEIADELMKVSEQVKSIALRLDPLKSLNIGRKHNPAVKEVREELFDKLKSGTHVTRDLIKEIYSDLSSLQITNIMASLKKIPNVESARDGISLKLFYVGKDHNEYKKGDKHV